MNYPCWLSKPQLEQAQALVDLGFHYCGDADNFCGCEYPCGKVGTWQFGTHPGECCLDAVCNGALYSWELETDPRCDEPGFFEARLAEAKKTIKTVIKNQKLKQQSSAIQLSLF
jgi:hypothetical protein